jgi:hypothetical protein
MANVSQIRGFEPFATLNSEGSVKVMPRTYTAKAATAIYPGDVVGLVDNGGTSDLQPIAAGTVVGMVGVSADYIAAAATNRACRVYPALSTNIFKAQMTAAYAADMVGKNVDHVQGSGAVGTGPFGTAGAAFSGDYLNNTAAATGGFHIIGLAPGSETGANAKVLVTFNEGAFVGAANGVADA